MTEKSYTYKCDIYPIFLRIIFTNNISDDLGAAFADSGNTFIVYFREPHPKLSDILHESEHVKNGVFKYIGQEPDYDNDEVDCYLMGWVGDKIDKSIKKYNK